MKLVRRTSNKFVTARIYPPESHNSRANPDNYNYILMHSSTGSGGSDTGPGLNNKKKGTCNA